MTVLASSAAAGSAAGSQVMPGVLGFLVVAAMSVALYFLLRSMNKQLRKVAPPRGSGGPARVSASEAKAAGAGSGQPGGQPGVPPAPGPSGKP